MISVPNVLRSSVHNRTPYGVAAHLVPCCDFFHDRQYSTIRKSPSSPHRGRTASYPTAPAQIPACGFLAPGSSEILASAFRLQRSKQPFSPLSPMGASCLPLWGCTSFSRVWPGNSPSSVSRLHHGCFAEGSVRIPRRLPYLRHKQRLSGESASNPARTPH